MLSFFPRDVLDEIWDLIESVSEGFPSYSYIVESVVSLEIRLVRIKVINPHSTRHPFQCVICKEPMQSSVVFKRPCTCIVE